VTSVGRLDQPKKTFYVVRQRVLGPSLQISHSGEAAPSIGKKDPGHIPYGLSGTHFEEGRQCCYFKDS
jgi:hypothetical protein